MGTIYPMAKLKSAICSNDQHGARVATGLTPEACRRQRLLRFAFEETPLTEIVGVIEEGNAASENVLLKCGFVREGMRRAYAEQRPAFRITSEQFMARSSGIAS